MNIELKAKNTVITDALSDYVQKRLSKLDKYFNKELNCTVTLIVEKETQKVEVTMPLDKYILRAEAVSKDMYSCIDIIEERLDRQIHKYKTKLNRKGRTSQTLQSNVTANENDIDDDTIIKEKEFIVKPMNSQEAMLQLEMLGHDFYTFLNEETNTICVIYKRKTGGYGLLLPTLS